MKRFGHKKSRDGCTTCKKRRVKCDERAPCGACTRHRVPCSLAPDALPTSNQLPTLQSTRQNQDTFVGLFTRNFLGDSPSSSSTVSTPQSEGIFSVPSNTNFSAIDPVPYFSHFLNDIERGGMQDWVDDLELMHHYTATAYCTFTHNREVQYALQHDVIHLGLEHSFLIQQILAFSGFHLSYTQPDQRRSYTLRASRYQDRAIIGLRTALRREFTSKNCHALYASSIFLIICAFATFPSYEAYNKNFSSIDSIVDILRLADGISAILRASDREIRDGPLKGLFSGKQDSPAAISDRVQQLIDNLQSLDLQIQSASFDCEEDERGMFQHLSQSITDALLNVHKRASLVVSPELRAIFLWPMLLSHRHLELISSRRPLALVIMSYYCVMLKYAAEDCWFLEGWGQSVSDSLESSLAGTAYEEAIKWPLSVIRM